MSAEHVGWAFRQPLPATRKFVLVALADRCNKDTLRCDPSIQRLAEDTGLDRATVIRALASLEEEGYIKRMARHRENGSQNSNQYRFPEVGGRTAPPPPSQSATPPGRTVRPEPEVEPEVEPIAPTARKRTLNDDLWDAMVEIFGPATTPSARVVRGKVVRGLMDAGATPAEIMRRAKAWPQHFDGATMTDLAFEKHYDTLGRKPLRRR